MENRSEHLDISRFVYSVQKSKKKRHWEADTVNKWIFGKKKKSGKRKHKITIVFSVFTFAFKEM